MNLYALIAVMAIVIVIVVWLWMLVSFLRRKRGKGKSTVYTLQLLRFDPQKFEEYTAWLIKRQTGYEATLAKNRQGFVYVKIMDKQGQLIGIAQCKRHPPDAALSHIYVRQTAAFRDKHNLRMVYLATTAFFTQQTREIARRLNVRLIDGNDLKRLLSSVQGDLPTAQIAPPVFEDTRLDVEHFRYMRPINGMWDDD
jgi:hypothetical protein